MIFSASRIGTWMDCPLRAHYRYDLKWPTEDNAAAFFGTSMHEALSVFYNGAGDYDAAVAKFKRAWSQQPKGLRYFKMTSYDNYRKRGLEMLAKVRDMHRFSTYNFIGSEVPFRVPFGNHELTGIVDLIGTERSGTGAELIKVTDFKTNTKDPSRAALALNQQFCVYLWAVTQREFWVGVEGNPDFPGVPNGEWLWETVAKMVPARGVWFSLNNAREIDVGPRTDVDFTRLHRVCDEIAKAIEADIHVPKIGEACTFCDYVEPCAFDVQVSIAAHGDPDDRHRWI